MTSLQKEVVNMIPTERVKKEVNLAYSGEEVVNLVRAAHQMSPYTLDLGPSKLRIENYSTASGRWRCNFIFSRNNKKGWVLDLIEYDYGMTMKKALDSLGALEEVGLKHLKHGISFVKLP